MHSEEKAIFLDRDGVLIRERGDYTWLLEDIKINDGVIPALKKFAKNNYKLIVISNQSGISQGLYSKADADYLHLHLDRVFSAQGINIIQFYYCPHHPSVSNCICRKPDSQLLEKAIAKFNINKSKSWFIGDGDRDIEAGNKAGVNCFKIDVNGNLDAVAEKILA